MCLCVCMHISHALADHKGADLNDLVTCPTCNVYARLAVCAPRGHPYRPPTPHRVHERPSCATCVAWISARDSGYTPCAELARISNRHARTRLYSSGYTIAPPPAPARNPAKREEKTTFVCIWREFWRHRGSA